MTELILKGQRIIKHGSSRYSFTVKSGYIKDGVLDVNKKYTIKIIVEDAKQ